MKRKLLAIVSSDASRVFSGEDLSQRLGISRVSIWKHIKKLQELGYEIESSAKGYRLLSSPDALYPWGFGEREPSIHYFQEVDSTMIAGKQLARKGCPGFPVVIAEKQNQGRGRLQRTWHSDEGGLYFTLILRPEIPAILMSRISFAASLCISRLLQEEFGINARLKWPNDILVDEKKICGMLAEMEMESDRVSFLNIGIGLNVNNTPGLKEPNAVSMLQCLNRPVSRKQILISFLDRMEKELTGPSLDHIIPLWKQQTLTLNRRVKIVTTTEEFEGIAVDVDKNGALLLKQADNTIKTVYYGDCFHQK